MVFQFRVSPSSPGCPATLFVWKADLKLDLPASASASEMLGLKACVTTPGSISNFQRQNSFLLSERARGPGHLGFSSLSA